MGRLSGVSLTPGKWPLQSLNQEAVRRELKLLLVPLGTPEGWGTRSLSALSWEEASGEFTLQQTAPPSLALPPSAPTAHQFWGSPG